MFKFRRIRLKECNTTSYKKGKEQKCPFYDSPDSKVKGDRRQAVCQSQKSWQGTYPQCTLPVKCCFQSVNKPFFILTQLIILKSGKRFQNIRLFQRFFLSYFIRRNQQLSLYISISKYIWISDILDLIKYEEYHILFF